MDDIMKKVEDFQYKNFVNCIEKVSQINKDSFLIIFLEIFIGNNISKNKPKFYHDVIDCTSLCGPEYDFFHKIIDSEYDIDKYLEIYNETKNIKNSQLGPLIYRCLCYMKYR